MLAIDGGTPESPEFIHFSKPWIGEEEKAEVLDTLNGMWLSRGPKVSRFEKEFADYIGVPDAVAMSSCTAALHTALVAKGIGEGDEVITSPITFPSTINAILYTGATPILADVGISTFNISVNSIRKKISPFTKAIIPVHIAGQACEMNEIMDIANEYGLFVLEDAAHGAGAFYKGKKLGCMGHAGAFSFYATKNITTGDGGMLTVKDDHELADYARVLSLHGIDSNAWKRYSKEGSANWNLIYPGFKYNMTDIEASIGIHQLKKIDKITELRTALAKEYDRKLDDVCELWTPLVLENRIPNWHLYIITLDLSKLTVSRDRFVELLKAENIGTGIHFVSAHKQHYYKNKFGYIDENFPQASWVSDRIISLPLHPQMTDTDIDYVVNAIKKVIKHVRK
jgi:dTDP-4-amino-4,6-dideoxygalactose transaminase